MVICSGFNQLSKFKTIENTFKFGCRLCVYFAVLQKREYRVEFLYRNLYIFCSMCLLMILKVVKADGSKSKKIFFKGTKTCSLLKWWRLTPLSPFTHYTFTNIVPLHCISPNVCT